MTTTITRLPASTSQSLGITLHGGSGSLHARLSDASDTTWAECDESCYGLMRFATAALPAGSLIDRIVVTARARRANGIPRLYVWFEEGDPGGYTTITPVISATFWSTDSAPLIATVAQLANGLLVGINAINGPLDIADMSLAITYIEIPVVTVTQPSATLAITAPTVEWTTVSDRPQSRFQVKEFSSAQYSAAGFNPATSTAFYDSGEQLGSARAWTPSAQLADGETYRFYVRAAQLVGSVTQWSAWDYNEQLVAVTPPNIPTLTIVPQDDQGRIKVRANHVGSPTWDFVTIQRTLDGTTWTDLRSASRAPTSGHNFVVFDYEAGNGQPVQYRARAIIDSGGDIASDWSTVSAPAFWESDDTWLKSPLDPTLNMLVKIKGIPTLKRRIVRGVIDIAGRPDPIVVSDVRKLVEGDVTFVALDETDLDALAALLDLGQTLLLQTPVEDGWGSRYIACGDSDEDRVSRRAKEPSRLLSVPFNEVLAPVGDVESFGITWDDVVAAYADWDAVEAAYTSWNALLKAHIG